MLSSFGAHVYPNLKLFKNFFISGKSDPMTGNPEKMYSKSLFGKHK